MSFSNPFKPIYDRINSITTKGGPVPDFPLIVDVELTSICNLKCLMCEHKYITRQMQPMSVEIFEELITQCKPYMPGIRLIMYSEPFLHSEILDRVKYVKEQGFLLHITTNGSILTKKQIEQLLDLGLDSITFSMQGATPEEYEVIRQYDKLDEIKEKIYYLAERRREKPFLHISTTVTERDLVKDIGEFKEKWSVVADLVTVGSTSWARILELDPEVIGELGVSVNVERKYVPCHDVLTKIAVYSNGDITVCCSDSNGKMIMGNIMRDNIKELWKSESYNSIRVLLKNMNMQMFDLCKNCYPAYEY